MIAQALLFAGSLAAILALVWLARRLGLGGEPRLESADEALQLAEDALCGFDAVDAALDRKGAAALVRGRDGRIMLLRRHGAHWAARPLEPDAPVRAERGILTVATGEPSFGEATLDLGDAAEDWASRLRATRI